jgi:retron-type reverse transcriptase
LRHFNHGQRRLLKLDVAKAFDNVSWAFLLSILRQRGFSPRWIRWILLLLRSSSTRVLINGRAGEAFLHGRGLRQGDPLSPLLFIIVMDVLAAMFRAAERVGVLTDLAARGVKYCVSLYADDVVVFSRPEDGELSSIRQILHTFDAASGLHVNYAKSVAAPIRCSPVAVEAVSPAFSCPLMQFPCSYLGLPLSLRRLHKRDL